MKLDQSGMRPRLPSLNALRAFEAAARHKSFTRAAEELCATQGAVSPKPSLPANFSIANASAFVITEAGRDYYNFCSGTTAGDRGRDFWPPGVTLSFDRDGVRFTLESRHRKEHDAGQVCARSGLGGLFDHLSGEA
jgi:Bacterial regulatory helix-turn-helix protein, lysR family